MKRLDAWFLGLVMGIFSGMAVQHVVTKHNTDAWWKRHIPTQDHPYAAHLEPGDVIAVWCGTADKEPTSVTTSNWSSFAPKSPEGNAQ